MRKQLLLTAMIAILLAVVGVSGGSLPKTGSPLRKARKS